MCVTNYKIVEYKRTKPQLERKLTHMRFVRMREESVRQCSVWTVKWWGLKGKGRAPFKVCKRGKRGG